MPNDYENPKYTNKNEYHAGDGPFQFPWWAIVIAFVVWWPLGLVFIGLNAAMKNGRLGGFEQKAREATRDRTASGAKLVYNAEFRPIYDTPAQPQPKAAAPHAAPQQAQVRAAGKKLKGAALATGLTVAGVLLLICALAALPDAIYWLPEALTEGGSYWTWLVEDSMPMLMSLTGGIGCLFGANHIRTTRRMRKKIDNIVGDAKYMYIQDIADAIPCSYEKCCKHLENCIDEGLFGPGAFLDMHRKCLVVKERPPEPTLNQRMTALRDQIYEMCEEKGEWAAMPQARSQAMHYMKGLHGAAALRRYCSMLEHFSDVDTLIEAVYRLQ